MRHWLLITAASLALPAICQAADESFHNELAQASTDNGLAIGGVRGEDIVVIPFDGPKRFYRSRYQIATATFGQGGTVIAWSIFNLTNARGAFFPSHDLILERVNGLITPLGRNELVQIGVLAVNEICDRLAFVRQIGNGTLGLYWSRLDLSNPSMISIVGTDIGSNASWSPDGRMLAYENSGDIYLFDTDTAVSGRLIGGHDPTWSPNGEVIAFRSSTGYAQLITPQGSLKAWPLSTYKPRSPIRWSPDGRYVILVERTAWCVPMLTSCYDLTVSRVMDGRSEKIWSLGGEAPPLAIFNWILDYRSFCSNCVIGRPFN